MPTCSTASASRNIATGVRGKGRRPYWRRHVGRFADHTAVRFAKSRLLKRLRAELGDLY